MKDLTAIQLGQIDTAVTVLDLVREGKARTRSEISEFSGLGRNIVAQRVAQLQSIGLISGGRLGSSNGGRAPRELEFNGEAGRVLVAEVGATHVCVAVADLQGRLDAVHEEQAAVSDGPEQILGRVDALFQHALTRTRLKGPICGLGIGLPGPVEFTSGRPVSPPLMPGWDDFPVGDYFTDKYDTPVWVDNEVNVMALGEFRAGIGQGIPDLIFVKVGHGIGAGLISQGRLHRGAQGCAGDIGHIGVLEESGVVCHCGNAGCLEALAGGAALERKGLAAALDGRSASLAETLRENGTVRAVDVRRAAQLGDSIALDLFNASATLVGEALAGIVNFFNPALIVLGGEVTNAGDMYLAAVRRAVLRRSLPLATRDLRIVRTQQPDRSGLTGAAFMVIDEVLSRDHLPVWLGKGKHPTDHSSSVRCVTGTA